MVKPSLRSRTFRRLQVKAPGGRTVQHYKRREPAKAKCADCKCELQAVPNKRATEMRKLAKTEKRPERPFGGKLCSACMRLMIKNTARKATTQ